MKITARLALVAIWFLCLLAAIVSSLWMLCAALVGSTRAWNLAVAFDRLSNTATGGNDRETISSRAYRASLAGQQWGCVLCKLLNAVQKDHCKNSEGS